MDKLRKRTKAIVLSVAMTAVLSLPVRVSAQNGLLQRGASTEVGRETNAGMFSQRNEASGVINNQTFGQELPIGNGVFLLFVAGVSYAILRRKEDEK